MRPSRMGVAGKRGCWRRAWAGNPGLRAGVCRGVGPNDVEAGTVRIARRSVAARRRAGVREIERCDT